MAEAAGGRPGKVDARDRRGDPVSSAGGLPLAAGAARLPARADGLPSPAPLGPRRRAGFAPSSWPGASGAGLDRRRGSAARGRDPGSRRPRTATGRKASGSGPGGAPSSSNGPSLTAASRSPGRAARPMSPSRSSGAGRGRKPSSPSAPSAFAGPGARLRRDPEAPPLRPTRRATHAPRRDAPHNPSRGNASQARAPIHLERALRRAFHFHEASPRQPCDRSGG